MSIILLTSLLLLCAAFAWSGLKYFQLRDHRLMFLTGMLGLMVAKTLITCRDAGPIDFVFYRSASELPGLGVSIMAFLGVMFVGNILRLDHAPRDLLPTRRLMAVAILVGIMTIVACLALGYWAYGASRDHMKQTIAESNLSLAKRLCVYSELLTAESHLAPEEVRASLKRLWAEAQAPYPGSYLCLIEKPGKITVHTKIQQAVGREVAGVKLGDADDAEAETVGALLKRRGSWAGDNINARGLPQLVGYTHLDSIDGLVVVHTPLKLVEEDLRAAAAPWAIGMTLIGGLFVPVLIGLLHSSYAFEQRRLREAEAKRLELETEMRNSQRMEALGRLAGGVAHDFNNLLTSVIGNVELARVTLDDPSELSETRSSLDEIEQAGQQAARLTKQLLAFSRQKEITTATFDLNAIILDLDQMLRRLLGADVEIVLDLGPKTPFALGDSALIEQILINLIVNARDAMPDGGTLRIRTRPSKVDLAIAKDPQSGSHPVLEVIDTGMGMEEAVTQRIFEPFFTTKSHGNGTGLGLATVYGNVQRMQGRIDVKSVIGEGTTFTVHLPWGEGEAMRTSAGSLEPAPRGTGQLILLCEDDAGVRTLTKSMLTQGGYRVITAADGAAAFKLAQERGASIDLFLTDVILPDTDGHVVAQRLRDEPLDLKVLYISGYTGEDLRDRDFPHQQADLLKKPFSHEELLTRVAQAIQRPKGAPA